MVKGTSLLTHATPLHPLFSIAKKNGERETKEKQSFKVARNYQKAVTKVKMIGTVLDILVRLEFKKKKIVSQPYMADIVADNTIPS